MIQAMAAGEATDVAGMRQLINRSIPVSYTHLDVYKRQIIRTGYFL